MIKNTAFLASLTVFLAVGWGAGELRFLAPYKAVLFRDHWPAIAAAITLLFLHCCAVYYGIARWLFVREAGRKLTYLDRQLTTSDAVLGDLAQQLEGERPHVA